MNRTLIATLLTAGFATAIPVAIAQTAPQQPKAEPSRHAQHDRQARRQVRLPSERVEARLAYLHTALKITDAQRAQWENFAAVMRKHARDADKRVQERRTRMAEGSKRPQLSAIERMERRQQAMATRAQRLNELISAGKPLYAAFTPEQKQVADELLSRQGREGHGRHRGARSRG
jgi:hypothetical protein